MLRIEARVPGTGRIRPIGTADGAAEGAAKPPARALVVLEPRAAPDARLARDARPTAGFVAQLIVGADPSLRPSRLERAHRAVAVYAAARRVA